MEERGGTGVFRLLAMALMLLAAVPVFSGRPQPRLQHKVRSTARTEVPEGMAEHVMQRIQEGTQTIKSRLAMEKPGRDLVVLSRADSVYDEGLRSILHSMKGVLLADSIISTARTFLGAPYRYGSSGPSHFDCSGFTSYVFRQFGIPLARSSSGQRNDGVKVSMDSVRRGDIVIMGGRRNLRSPGHVGIVVNYQPESGVFSFIHASRHGVMENWSNEKYYDRRMIEVRRVLP